MLIRNEEEANRAKTIPILSLCSYCENMLTYPYILTIERSNKNRYHPDCAAKLVESSPTKTWNNCGIVLHRDNKRRPDIPLHIIKSVHTTIERREITVTTQEHAVKVPIIHQRDIVASLINYDQWRVRLNRNRGWREVILPHIVLEMDDNRACLWLCCCDFGEGW